MYSIEQQNNKRIAKNTLLLYFRMLFLMAISLYTSRVVLEVLGVEDYGIYNVVGGIVTLFSFLNSAMTTSTQRYITFELGTGNIERLKTVFSTSVQIHFLISLVVVVLAETVGLWLLINKMVVPETRFIAAMWVYQLSILTTVIAIMSYPFNAAIVAHEKMSAFAYISIVEGTLKLAIVFLLSLCNSDKLVFYALLVVAVHISIQALYAIYCFKNFEETRCYFRRKKSLFKEMLFFAGWNLWGNLASILFTQGVNILLNMFFGPVVNAARAVSVQVQSAINHFSTNFQMAMNPQITKTFASGKIDEMHTLVCRCSKFTFLLLFVMCLPVLIETPIILKIWLKNVPDYTVLFLRLMLIIMIIDSSAKPLMTAAATTGKVKKYQLIIGGILLAIVPLSYMVLKLGAAPWAVFVVHLCICIVAYIVRLFIIRPMINLRISFFVRMVVVRCAFAALLGMIVPMGGKLFLSESLLNSFILILLSVTCAMASSVVIGLDSKELQVVLEKVRLLKRKRVS